MGNSQSREGRHGPPHSPNDPEAYRRYPFGDAERHIYSARQGRASQSNLGSIFSSAHRERERDVPQDEAALALRRETKAEREARRVEKDRLARERERERSMREESVDGGYLVTQGVYTGTEDYNKGIVRSLMIERRLAPFWPGLEEIDPSWTEHQLIAAVHKEPIPAADEPPQQTVHWPPADGPQYTDAGVGPSSGQDASAASSPLANLSASPPPPASGSLLKGRAKTLASVTIPTSKGASSTDLTQRESTLPPEPTVNGQRLEAYLYKDARECNICFLYYPPYLNEMRCCYQAICSECFVQIKRPDPHPPEHHDDQNNPTAQAQREQEREQNDSPATLVSEPASCPYCATPECGVTYKPPPIRRGLIHGSQATSPSPLPSPISYTSENPLPAANRKRAASLPAHAPNVITTDRVRPEWSTKLAHARAQAARRSAAATALHTAAYMMGGSRERRLPLFRNRTSNRTAGSEENGEGSSISASATRSDSGGQPLDIIGLMQAAARGQTLPDNNSPAGQRGSSRRNRADDIEDMMMMEAIRQSLQAEEERRRKEEKERAKEEKKKAKEDKKAQKDAQKATRKQGGSSSNLYGLIGASRSNLTVNSAQPSMVSQDSAAGTPAGKGKGPARERSESNPGLAGASQDAGAQAHLERSRANLQPPSETYGRPSHLRGLSNASSSASSLMDPSPNASGVQIPRAGASSENVSNVSGNLPGDGPRVDVKGFSSLMSMIENVESGSGPISQFGKEPEHNSPATAGHESGQALELASETGKSPSDLEATAGVTDSHATSRGDDVKREVEVFSSPTNHFETV